MKSRRGAALLVTASTGANTVIVSVQALVLIPVFLQQLGSHFYGAWLASGEVLAWLLVSDLGLANLLTQRIGAAHAQRDHRATAELLVAGSLLLGVLAVAVAAAGVGLSFVIPRWFDLTVDQAEALQRTFALASISTAVVIVFMAAYAYGRAVQQTALVSATSSVAALTSFVVTVVLAFRGWNLYAIGLGLVSRALVQLIGLVAFAMVCLPAEVKACLAVRRSAIRELLRAAPATALSGFAYAFMNQTELLVVAFVFSPSAAALLMVNRKAIELVRSLGDSITFGAYGAYAHLTASTARERSRLVFHEILSLRSAVAIALVGAYVALNQSFLTLWVGAGQYYGFQLTLLFALQSIIAGNAFLVNLLYRASGNVVGGSLLLTAESVLRVALMIGLSLVVGLSGIPLAGIVTGVIFFALCHAGMEQFFGRVKALASHISWKFWLVGIALLGAGAVLSLNVARASWTEVLLFGTLFSGTAFMLLIRSTSHLARYRPRTILAAMRPRVLPA